MVVRRELKAQRMLTFAIDNTVTAVDDTEVSLTACVIRITDVAALVFEDELRADSKAVIVAPARNKKNQHKAG